ncbi:MAG: DUF1828 domain-containing protein [Actinobacteria bacterium]|nr:DUF1828 domain-containing protein [Actinomycetota bacterium]
MSDQRRPSEDLIAALRAAFAAHEVSPGRYVLQTPFQFDDGDGYPVVVEQYDGGWRLTDLGGTASHLGGDDVDFTPARLDMRPYAAKLGERPLIRAVR